MSDFVWFRGEKTYIQKIFVYPKGREEGRNTSILNVCEILINLFFDRPKTKIWRRTSLNKLLMDYREPKTYNYK